MNILFATTNTGKMREVSALLKLPGLKLFYLKDMDKAIEPPQETGLTFEANALIKARYYHEHYRMPVIADDAGLVVPDLNNEPGVFSARYAGPGATDEQNNRKLLERLKKQGLVKPPAYFQAVVVYIDNGAPHIFEGRCHGVITGQPRGTNGFGYDPIFEFVEKACTFAEMDLNLKNSISHRSKAFASLAGYLKKSV